MWTGVLAELPDLVTRLRAEAGMVGWRQLTRTVRPLPWVRTAQPRPCSTRFWTAVASAAHCRSSSWPSGCRNCRSGRVLRVLADDPAAANDVPAWCRLQRQEFAGSPAPHTHDVRRMR